ncbi:MAG: DNA replication/repair protein RecF, partial [Actinomycetota bacterium]
KRVRSVFSGPDDLDVVGGDPSERRRFMDEALRSLWPLKEGATAAYDRVLRQRNRLLKEWDGPGERVDLQAWDQELVALGSELMRLRSDAVGRVAPAAADAFEALSGDRLEVEYVPSAWGPDVDEAFRIRLAERRGDEFLRRTTLVGPHRDDLLLAVQDLVARGFASHGEGWGAALCLRLGLADAVAAETREDPVRLFDDPFSGLDPERRDRLARRMTELDPLAIAVPDDQHIPGGATVWRVKEGRVVAE